MSTKSLNLTAAGLKPGDKIDKFEVIEQIGLGGMSTVWKGYDRLLSRNVAIKQITCEEAEDQDHDTFLERFRAEAATQKRLAAGHKNLVRIIDFVEEPRGLFIIMEFIDGPSLEQALAANPHPVEQRQALGIIGATALALGAIHAAGLVHRDLKPANIMLPKTGGLKVCDFGLATVIGNLEAMGVGTVRYMAPELFQAGTVDGRADIYSLGLIAYEMLAGRAKFNEAFKIVLRDQRNQPMRWMKWHTNVRAAAPPLNTLNHAIPKTLSDLVARMMEKDPVRRIASAEELLDAIRRHFTSHSPAAALAAGEEEVDLGKTAAVAAGSAEPTARVPKKSKLPLLLAGLAVFWLAVGLAVWGWNQHRVTVAKQAIRQQALKEYNAAIDVFQNKKYSDAKGTFERLLKAWPNDPALGGRSKSRVSLCEAMIQAEAQASLGFKERDYTAALSALDAAEKVGDIDRDYLRQKRDEFITRDSVAKVIAKVEALITEGQQDRTKFDDARHELQQVNEVRKFEILDDERKRLDELDKSIPYVEAKAEVDAAIAEADRRIALGRTDPKKMDEARKFLADCKKKYPTRQGEFQGRIDTLNRADEIAATRASRDQAEAAGNLAEAIKAATLLTQLEPGNAGHQAKLKQLEGKFALEDGKAKLATGDAAGASVALRKAKDLGMAEADTFLSQIKLANELAVIIKAGDDAVAAGDLATAQKRYAEAIKLGAPAEVQGKLVKARVAQTLQQARDLLNQGKLEEARGVFAKVLGDEPDNADARQGITEAERWKDALAALARGDSLRRQRKYSDARTEFERAVKILSAPEMNVRVADVAYKNMLDAQKRQLEERIGDNEYDAVIAAAKREIAGKRWKSALGWIDTAIKQRNSEELQKLKAEVLQNLPKEGEP